MGRKYDPLVLILVLATIKASAANVDDASTKQKRSMASMVATLCDGSGSPNVYLTPDNGWQATDVGSDTDSVRTKACLDDKKDILQLCKMMYSDQDVRNIMEVEHTIINHWPDRNGYKHQHNVTAYKCLVGPFESEALLVPQSCKFQHTKGPCGSLLYWKKEAMAMCEDMHMYERIYSILLPCVGRVAEFAGVEYVCCPKENIHSPKPASPKNVTAVYQNGAIIISWYQPPLSNAKIFYWVIDYRTTNTNYWRAFGEGINPPQTHYLFKDIQPSTTYQFRVTAYGVVSYSNPSKIVTVTTPAADNSPAATPKPDKHEPHEVPKSRNAYTAYIQNDQAFLSRYRNEHEKFMAAKAALDLRHRTQIDKMTQEWQEARNNIKKVKETDKKKAETLYDEVMTRFQRLYKGLEQAYVSEKTQLISVHLQRRQGVLNKKKREYLEQYMLELQNPKSPNIHSIFKYLKDYIKVEEKDREHTFNHYLHVRDSNPEEAHHIQPVALEHLKVIDQRIQQSLDMLNKLPEYSKLIMPKIEKFREPYMATANQALETLSQPLVIDTPKEEPKKTGDVNLKTDSSINTKIDWGTPSQTKGESDDSEDENATEHNDDSFDEEVDEDESQQVNFVANENNFVAHAAENKHIFKEGHVLQSAGHLQSATGSVFGIAIGSVAVFVIIVVAVIMLRKHSHRRPVTHGFVEVDPAASPEERHVANMQMNGYENPTYQYFELNSNQQKL